MQLCSVGGMEDSVVMQPSKLKWISHTTASHFSKSTVVELDLRLLMFNVFVPNIIYCLLFLCLERPIWFLGNIKHEDHSSKTMWWQDIIFTSELTKYLQYKPASKLTKKGKDIHQWICFWGPRLKRTNGWSQQKERKKKTTALFSSWVYTQHPTLKSYPIPLNFESAHSSCTLFLPVSME